MNQTVKIVEQLIKQLKEAENKFSANLKDEEKKAIGIDINSKCYTILDYLYLNYPSTTQDQLRRNIPLMKKRQKQEEYITAVAKINPRDKKSPKQSKDVLNFLRYLYQANKSNNYAISYLDGATKHHTPNNFGENGHTSLNAKFESNHPNPIQQNLDGSLEIAGGFIKASPGATLNFNGTRIITPQGNIHFDHLRFSGYPFEGDLIIFDDYKPKFTDWVNDCLKISEAMLEEYKVIVQNHND